MNQHIWGLRKIFEKRYGGWEFFGLKGGPGKFHGAWKIFLKRGARPKRRGLSKKGGLDTPTELCTKEGENWT